MNGAAAILKALERQGVEIIFGHPGGTIMPTYDALYDSPRAVDRLLREAGARFAGQDDAPVLSKAFETSIPGLFVAGSAGFGNDTRTVFIENGREHAKIAVREIAQRMQVVPR